MIMTTVARIVTMVIARFVLIVGEVLGMIASGGPTMTIGIDLTEADMLVAEMIAEMTKAIEDKVVEAHIVINLLTLEVVVLWCGWQALCHRLWLLRWVAVVPLVHLRCIVVGRRSLCSLCRYS